MKNHFSTILFVIILVLPNLTNAAQVFYYTGNELTPQSENTPQGRVTAIVTLDAPVSSDFTGIMPLSMVTMSAYGETITGASGYFHFENGSIDTWSIGGEKYIWGPDVEGLPSWYDYR